jgi:hypothetical protein
MPETEMLSSYLPTYSILSDSNNDISLLEIIGQSKTEK